MPEGLGGPRKLRKVGCKSCQIYGQSQKIARFEGNEYLILAFEGYCFASEDRGFALRKFGAALCNLPC